jgi:hypothetical protein
VWNGDSYRNQHTYTHPDADEHTYAHWYAYGHFDTDEHAQPLPILPARDLEDVSCFTLDFRDSLNRVIIRSEDRWHENGGY